MTNPSTTLDLDALERHIATIKRECAGWVHSPLKHLVEQMGDILSGLTTEIRSERERYRALQERVEGAEKALHEVAETPNAGWMIARAYFAARTKAGEPHAEQGGEPADQKYIIDDAGNTGWTIP